MTVRELQEQLATMPADADVMCLTPSATEAYLMEEDSVRGVYLDERDETDVVFMSATPPDEAVENDDDGEYGCGYRDYEL